MYTHIYLYICVYTYVTFGEERQCKCKVKVYRNADWTPNSLVEKWLRLLLGVKKESRKSQSSLIQVEFDPFDAQIFTLQKQEPSRKASVLSEIFPAYFLIPMLLL